MIIIKFVILFFKVLDTMVGYVRHFFGCEGKKYYHEKLISQKKKSQCKIDFTKIFFFCLVDCSRHFLDASENGDAIKRDVIDKNSSILWYVKKAIVFSLFILYQ